MLTRAHDVWVKEALGVDPADFARDQPATDADQQGTAKPPSSTPPVPPGAQFAQQNKAAIDAATKANQRVVLAGPALDARNRLDVALRQLAAAVAANNVPAAQAALAAAQTETRTVLASPDPATLPIIPGAQPNEVLYGKGQSEAQDVSATDINQGDHLGDCYLLSSLGEIAKIDPGAIKKMIKDNGNGTYTVTFHQHKTGLGLWVGKIIGSEYEDVQETVDGNFASGTANAAAGQDEVAGKKEIWVQVVEKAYAKLHGGYGAIQGGVASNAMAELTGKEATLTATGSVSLADLQTDITAHKPVVLDTPPEDPAHPLPFGLHGGHSYMLDKLITDASGKVSVILLNPWGFAQPLPIPFDQLGKGIQRVAVGAMP